VLISSYPDEFLVLKDLIIHVISFVEKDLMTGGGGGEQEFTYLVQNYCL
jgi:hypothetical protein